MSHSSIEVNKANKYGSTPLHVASENGYEKVVAQLLPHPSIEVNKARDDERTPLIKASENGHEKVVEQLLSHSSIEVNKLDKSGWLGGTYLGGATALYWASNK